MNTLKEKFHRPVLDRCLVKRNNPLFLSGNGPTKDNQDELKGKIYINKHNSTLTDLMLSTTVIAE